MYKGLSDEGKFNKQHIIPSYIAHFGAIITAHTCDSVRDSLMVSSLRHPLSDAEKPSAFYLSKTAICYVHFTEIVVREKVLTRGFACHGELRVRTCFIKETLK